MRILRSRSDHEVSSTGFALFMAGLVLAGFVGGAIRTLLSSEKIQSRILSELQTALPDMQVKMDVAKVSLARGIWPGLSIAIPKLHLTKPEACGQTYGQLHLENIDLPLEVLALIRRQVHWGTIGIEKLNLNFGKTACPPEVAAKPAEPGGTEAPFAAPVDKELQRRARLAQAFAGVQRLREHISGLRILEADISSSTDPSWHLGVQNLELIYGGALDISANVKFEKMLVGGKIEHSASLIATADDDAIEWQLKSPMKEGLITWEGKADHKNDTLNQKVNIHQLPLKDVLLEFQTWMDANRGGSPRFIWFSCNLDQNGKLSEYHKIPMRILDCKIDGEGEHIIAGPGQQVFPWERVPLHQPLVFHVNKLSLQTLFDLFGKSGLPAILPKPGQWTGEIRFSSPKNWQMNGELEGAEVIFSNQSVRARQLVAKVSTAVQEQGDQITGELSDIVLGEGSSKGKVSFRFNAKQQAGEFHADFTSLSLSPAVQNLMVGGISTPLSVSGQGRIASGEVVEWKGNVQWQNTQGAGWSVNEPKLETDFHNGKFILRARAQSAELSPDFVYSEALTKLFGAVANSGSWRMRDPFAQVLVLKSGGEIQQARVIGPAGNAIKVSGRWERGGNLSVTGEGAGRRWRLRGREGRLSVDSL